MANLSNINNKFLVTTGGNVLIGQTSAVGSSIFQVTGASTFGGDVNVENASTRFISLNYEDSVNSIISHSGTNFGLESLNVRGDTIRFYTDYDASSPKGNITLTLENSHNAKFEGNVGIGISAGTNNLHIYKSNATALIQASNTSGIAQVQFFPRDASNVAHLQSIKGVDSNLTFLTGGNSGNSYVPTQRMRIDSGGSVIIGDGATSGTPAADYRSLEIGRQGNTITGAPWKSNLYFSTNATITAGSSTFTARYLNELPMQMVMEDGIFTWSNAVAPTAVGDTISFTERMRIDSSGNTTITTTSNQGGLTVTSATDNTVLGINNTATGGLAWRLQSIGGGSGSGQGKLLIKVGGGETASNLISFVRETVLGGIKMGIGTTSPTFQLSIENHATTTSTATMELDGKRTNGTDGPVGEMIFSNNGDTFATVAGVRDGADNSGSIVFQTQDSGTFGTRMTISSDGNVGIGVSNPETARLLVRGSTNDSASQIFQAANFGGATKYAIRADGDNKWYKSDNSLSMVLTSTGNVGIGTTAPTSKLHVNGTGATHGEYFRISNGTTQIYELQPSIVNVTNNGFGIYDVTDSTYRLVIDTSGNVGIGTSDPDHKLEVVGGLALRNSNSRLYFGTNNGPDRRALEGDVNGTLLQVGESYSKTALYGNVGIGETSPSAKLHVKSTANADVIFKLENTNTGTSAGAKIELIDDEGGSGSGAGALRHSISSTSQTANRWTIGSGAAAGQLQFSTLDTFAMMIDEEQNVLINQTVSNTTADGFGVHPTGSGGGNLVACHNGTAGTALIAGHGAFDGTIVDFRRASVQVGTISVTSSATAYNTSASDERLKKNITDWNENILDKFKDIQPKEFHFNEQEDTEKKQKGYIAQNEVDKFPEAYPLIYNEELKEDRHMYNPSGMTVYLMKAIQELKAEIELLKSK